MATGLVHPEPCRYHAKHREHHRGTGFHISAAGAHGQGARGDHPEVRKRLRQMRFCRIKERVTQLKERTGKTILLEKKPET